MNFKLTIYPAIDEGNFYTTFKFETKQELEAAKNSMADLLLFLQDQAKLMEDYSNVFLCEELVDGEWEEIEGI